MPDERRETRKSINDRLTRTSIKGRAYIDVAQRVQGFWELYPKGRILTQLIADDGKRCTFRAEAYDMSEGGAGLLATGHAYEVNSGRGVNATSYIENCETSAVGRALGMLGIGSTDSIASADEVEAAVAQQAAQGQAQPSEGEQRADPAVKQAKQRLWRACNAYAERHGRDPRAILEGIRNRPNWEETVDFMEMAAQELESDVCAEVANG